MCPRFSALIPCVKDRHQHEDSHQHDESVVLNQSCLNTTEDPRKLLQNRSHQVDQFLFFTGSTQAEVVAAQVANYKYPECPELEDFGEVILRGNGGTGYVRVDWFTPDGLPTWGDGRAIILGTEGYIELRKYCDIAGRPGGEHLFLVDQESTHYIDCSDADLPYGRQLIGDITNRTETAMSQAHCFLASELALQAQIQARRLGNLEHE